MKKLVSPLLWVILVSMIMAVPLMNPTEQTMPQESVVDPADAIRLSALDSGAEMVNASDIQELRERANANVSHALSNTSLADLESDNLTQLLQIRYRERKRQERLLVIQTQILQRLRMNRQPNISASMFSEEEQKRLSDIVVRMDLLNNNKSNNRNNETLVESHRHMNDGTGAIRIHHLHTTIQRLQSFYPSCSLPNNTDKSTWELPGSFRIFYEVPLSRYSFGAQVTVLLAKLRLYKFATSFGREWEANLAELERYNLVDSLIHNAPMGGINVSVYQYMKPLRYKRKERKRLVDTRTVTFDQEGWIEFNVVSSLNYWFHHSQRNYGFDVEVEDAMGNKLNPNLFFRNLNCSSAETAPQDPPFPNIRELHPEMMGENESALLDNETYPTLDLQTADVTNLNLEEAAFHLFQSSSFSNGGDVNRRMLRKRHLHHRDEHHRHNLAEKKQCTSETNYFTFAELGLDNTVLSPEGFHWTFCTGSCPEPEPSGLDQTSIEPSSASNRLLHRLGKLWRYLLKHSTKKADYECVAVNKQPLHIVYSNDYNEIQETTLEKFLPTECSCRNS